MSINVYKFVKNFICPYCNKKPDQIHGTPHLTATEHTCPYPCQKTYHIEYSASDSLLIHYDYLRVEIAVDATESLFNVLDTQDNHILISLSNEIPKFYERTTPQAAIIFLETLVTFQ